MFEAIIETIIEMIVDGIIDKVGKWIHRIRGKNEQKTS